MYSVFACVDSIYLENVNIYNTVQFVNPCYHFPKKKKKKRN